MVFARVRFLLERALPRCASIKEEQGGLRGELDADFGEEGAIVLQAHN